MSLETAIREFDEKAENIQQLTFDGARLSFVIRWRSGQAWREVLIPRESVAAVPIKPGEIHDWPKYFAQYKDGATTTPDSEPKDGPTVPEQQSQTAGGAGNSTPATGAEPPAAESPTDPESDAGAAE